MFISHRINTISELDSTPIEFGVEVDVRDYGDNLILSHDPFIMGESLDEFLKNYKHRFIIFNIKSERIEYKILEKISKYKIKDYFFLDSSFPMIYNLSKMGEKNIALRFSEFESIESVIKMTGSINWVWVDCFTIFPLTKEIFDILKERNFKICIVSPELQNKQDEIFEYKKYMIDNGIVPDMICTKVHNIEKWGNIFNYG